MTGSTSTTLRLVAPASVVLGSCRSGWFWDYAGRRGMLEVWPAVLVAGVSFAVPQFLMATLHGPWLVDIVAAACSMACLIAFLRVWRPASARRSAAETPPRAAEPGAVPGAAWIPWVVLTVLVFAWGTPQVKAGSTPLGSEVPGAGLHNLVEREPPSGGVTPERRFTLNCSLPPAPRSCSPRSSPRRSCATASGSSPPTGSSALRRARASLTPLRLMLALG